MRNRFLRKLAGGGRCVLPGQPRNGSVTNGTLSADAVRKHRTTQARSSSGCGSGTGPKSLILPGGVTFHRTPTRELPHTSNYQRAGHVDTCTSARVFRDEMGEPVCSLAGQIADFASSGKHGVSWMGWWSRPAASFVEKISVVCGAGTIEQVYG